MKYLIIIFLALTLIACEKDPVPFVEKHSLIFDPGNEETFFFSDHRPDSLNHAHREIKNGFQLGRGIKYDFHFIGKEVVVKSARQNIIVKYYSDALVKHPEIIPLEEGVFRRTLDVYGSFIIEEININLQ